MKTAISKERLLILMLMLAGSVLLLLPAQALCSGIIPLTRGAIVTVTDMDDASKGGPESSFLNLKYSGSTESDSKGKTLRAMAKASPNSQASHWATISTRFSVQKGNDGAKHGRARITLYGLSFSGAVNTPRSADGKATLKMIVFNAKNKTKAELNLMTASGNGVSPKIFQKDKAGGSIDFPVAADDTITVELELIAAAGNGFQNVPAEVDFYTEQKKVTFEGLRIEILDTDAPIPIAMPLPEQVFFYDNARCVARTSTDYLILNKGEQVDDLARRSTSETIPDTWNDRVACLKIGASVSRVIVYQNVDFKGKSRTYTRTRSNPNGVWSLQGNGWDKIVSSIVVE